MIRLTTIGIIALISGCCQTPVVTAPVALPLPVERPKPKIEAGEVACLSGETKRKLVTRDATWEAEVLECRAIIQSTRGEK
ncbi:MAG TPA: hypothetical protein ENK38_01280 [Gammaproteobacteria bacterium]|nr:hypothetical protein [Gammaproteobacteria bacterium]